MKTYESYKLSENLVKYLEAKKGSKFARDYYNEHGQYPASSDIASASTLTDDELEYAKHLAYENYISNTSVNLNFTKPEETVNTPEQDAVAEEIANALLSGEKNIVVDDVNNIKIPSGVTVLGNISGNFENGATVRNESAKSMTLNNTGEDPVDIQIESNTTTYLVGKYNDIYLTGKSISAASNKYGEVSGEITIAPSVSSNVSVTAAFVGVGAGINYAGDQKLTISNGNSSGTGCLDVYAPNATVEMSGKYDVVEANISEDTLILKSSFHARELRVLEGRVMYYGTDIKDFVGKPISGDIIVEPYSLEINNTNVSKMTSNAGVYKLVEDINYNRGISFGILSNGKYRYELNGHNMTCGNSTSGSFYVRGTAKIEFVGNGKITNNANSYGVWIDGANVEANVYGGDFEAYTHVMYSYMGTINIYGGSFKMLDANPELDVNGHCKFLLNCYDANYKSGTAKINVYGGKFYNFDPSNAYSEPGGPVSYVADGYHVVESVEDNVPVFTVVKD